MESCLRGWLFAPYSAVSSLFFTFPSTFVPRIVAARVTRFTFGIRVSLEIRATPRKSLATNHPPGVLQLLDNPFSSWPALDARSKTLSRWKMYFAHDRCSDTCNTCPSPKYPILRGKFARMYLINIDDPISIIERYITNRIGSQ